MRIKKAASIAAMKVLVHHNDTDIIFLITPRDLWIYDADSVEADDATDVIQPTNVDGAGRWVRIKFTAADVDFSEQMPAHKTTHQNGGDDEISVAGLSGVLADAQTAAAHKTSHENNGSDEISVAGLSGVLADPQTPAAHTHTLADVTDAGDVASEDIVPVAKGGTGTGTPSNHIADPAGGGTTDAEARTAINSILDALEAHGIVAGA